jgi:hypothetical protein
MTIFVPISHKLAFVAILEEILLLFSFGQFAFIYQYLFCAFDKSVSNSLAVHCAAFDVLITFELAYFLLNGVFGK